MTALSLPAAALITLIGGAIFDLVEGTILASLASILGATLSFSMARTYYATRSKRALPALLKASIRVLKKKAAFIAWAFTSPCLR